MATIDDIINGSFAAIGAKPAYLSQPYNPADYSSIYAAPQGGTTPKTDRYYPPAVPGVDMATLATLNANMRGRGQPAQLSTASAMAAADRLAASSPGLPLNPTGQYNAGNPFVLSALTAQQGAKPTVPTMASRVTGYGTPRAPTFPVAATPEIQAAYADVQAKKPGALKVYADLLANAAPTMGQKPAKSSGGLASLITGKGTPRATGGLFGLLFGGGNSAPAAPYGGRYSPAQLADRAAQGQAIGDANRRNPNPTYSASGENNAFMPTSYQNSVRQQTGY